MFYIGKRTDGTIALNPEPLAGIEVEEAIRSIIIRGEIDQLIVLREIECSFEINVMIKDPDANRADILKSMTEVVIPSNQNADSYDRIMAGIKAGRYNDFGDIIEDGFNNLAADQMLVIRIAWDRQLPHPTGIWEQSPRKIDDVIEISPQEFGTESANILEALCDEIDIIDAHLAAEIEIHERADDFISIKDAAKKRGVAISEIYKIQGIEGITQYGVLGFIESEFLKWNAENPIEMPVAKPRVDKNRIAEEIEIEDETWISRGAAARIRGCTIATLAYIPEKTIPVRKVDGYYYLLKSAFEKYNTEHPIDPAKVANGKKAHSSKRAKEQPSPESEKTIHPTPLPTEEIEISEFMTISDVCELTGKTAGEIINMMNHKLLPYRIIGGIEGKRMVRREDFEAKKSHIMIFNRDLVNRGRARRHR